MKRLLVTLTILLFSSSSLALADDTQSLLEKASAEAPAVFSETARASFSCLFLTKQPAADPCEVTIDTTGHFNRLAIGSFSAREYQPLVSGKTTLKRSWRLVVSPRDINPAKSPKASSYLSLLKNIKQKKEISIKAQGRAISPLRLQVSVCPTCGLLPLKPQPGQAN